MRKTLRLKPEQVGSAFLSNMGLLSTLTQKGKRKTVYRKLIRALRALDLVPATLDPEYITSGVDRNGDTVVLIEGPHNKPSSAAPKTAKA